MEGSQEDPGAHGEVGTLGGHRPAENGPRNGDGDEGTEGSRLLMRQVTATSPTTGDVGPSRCLQTSEQPSSGVGLGVGVSPRRGTRAEPVTGAPHLSFMSPSPFTRMSLVFPTLEPPGRRQGRDARPGSLWAAGAVQSPGSQGQPSPGSATGTGMQTPAHSSAASLTIGPALVGRVPLCVLGCLHMMCACHLTFYSIY